MLAVQCTPPNLSSKLTSLIAPAKHSTESRQSIGWMAAHYDMSDYFLILFAQAITHQACSLSSARKVSQVACPAEPAEEHSFHLSRLKISIDSSTDTIYFIYIYT